MTDDSLTFIALTTYEYLLLTTTVTGIKRDHKQSKSERENARTREPHGVCRLTHVRYKGGLTKKSEDHILIGSYSIFLVVVCVREVEVCERFIVTCLAKFFFFFSFLLFLFFFFFFSFLFVEVEERRGEGGGGER